MQIVATKLTAALAGAWTIMGMSTYMTWAHHQALDATAHAAGFFAAGLVFLFVPCIFFVAGPQWLKIRNLGHIQRELLEGL